MTPEEFSSTKHDYIIIGGGAAGLLLASRLSEDKDVTVGVIEAGLDQSKNPAVYIPGMALQTLSNDDLDWQFETVPQEYNYGRVHAWPRGKGLGGSSMINMMMFSNCSKRDLDSWALLGNEGWNWDSLQPYYRKFETFSALPEDRAKELGSGYLDPKLRGTNGPIKTTIPESTTGWVEKTFHETCKNAGYPDPVDPRTGNSLGSFNQLMSVDPDTKTRSYSYTGFLEPNLDRPNLRVLTNAKVSKIMFDESQKDEAVATGVEFLVEGKEYTANAEKEVIVCAGTVQTPQILELSGIGDKNLLAGLGIKLVVDNPAVGTNLQDHPLAGLCYKAKDGYPTMEGMRDDPSLATQALDAYTKYKAGPLTGGLTGVAFSSLRMVCPELTNTEINQLVDTAREFQSTGTKKQLEIQEAQLQDPKEAIAQLLLIPGGVDFKASRKLSKAFAHTVSGHWVMSAVVGMHTFSRGTVHITSSNPLIHPAIDPNYMSHPLDVELLGRSLMHLRQLTRTEPFASTLEDGPVGDKISLGGAAGPIQDPKTLEEAKEYIKWNCITCYHPIGTASMLPKEEGGVVDINLKVYGTKNVRVVDASIFPLHVQGNIISLVYAVAERAADIIKGKVSV